MRTLLVNIIVILIILVGGGAAMYYYNQSASYIKTDNSRIDGQQVPISATAAGQLVDWNGAVGKNFNSGDRVGSIQTGTTKVDLTFPINGTLVQQNAVPNMFVAPGTPLARAYDLTHLWVTANIEETRINDVKVGQAVDIYVDAFPGTVLTGKVDKVGLATAGSFSVLPTSNTTANYTKVTQVIPVTITIDGYKGLGLIPGMSTSVRIHL
jgi:multidrug resistance efflux pump